MPMSDTRLMVGPVSDVRDVSGGDYDDQAMRGVVMRSPISYCKKVRAIAFQRK